MSRPPPGPGQASPPPWMLAPEALARLQGLELGGKVRGLLRMAKAGVPVPPWHVIPAEAAAGRPWDNPEDAASLEAVFRRLNVPPFSGVAVRSSASVEDSASASFAGVFQTRMIAAAGELPEAAGEVLDSAKAAAARAYQREDVNAPPMAIILQAAVPAELSGVLFSAHPAEATLDHAYLEVVHGAGGALVSGAAEPSGGALCLQDGAVSGWTAGADGPETFSSELAQTLARHLLRLEAVFDAALDIEFAVAQGQVWFLQARPITALRPSPMLLPVQCATSWFFDQRLNKPATPMSWSTLLQEVLHFSVAEPLRNLGAPTPEPLLIRYAGQPYVAHAAFRRLLGGIPRLLLSPDLRQLFPRHCHCPPGESRRNAGILPGLARFLGKFRLLRKDWRQALCNARQWRAFQARLDRHLDSLPNSPPDDAGAWLEEWEHLQARIREFLRIHRWSIMLADSGYHALRLLSRAWPARGGHGLEERLMRGLDLPTIAANAALAEVLQPEASPETRARFKRDYGHRSPSLDYADPTWAEMLDAGTLAAHYGTQAPPLPEHQASKPFSPLNPLRTLLRMREEQRMTLERVLARQRAMLLHQAAALCARGVLPQVEDVWLLEWREFAALLQQVGPACPPVCLALRQHALLIERLIPRPQFIGPGTAAPPETGTVLRGIGASGGVARGRAVLLARPGPLPEVGEGRCIAVLPALDPAWTPLLRQVAGAVIERGGLLSHAAIVAREYGVPVVMGVPGALDAIPEGSIIEVDGTRGEIRIDAAQHAREVT